ncbi:MAG: tRNA lysidine(34) synthetase TilS [Desulfobulbaceae bacterium]|nr:tRNA lysidine(34) synthetase TilS [Desulfobulbaceae bacterium]
MIRDSERRVTVGISGGPDSVALFHVLLFLRETLGISLVAAYINHGLRPEEAEIEEHFVRSLSEMAQVAYQTIEVDVREFARQEKISLEHAARDLRYKALREIGRTHGAPLIAVAHTADDQAEEILLRLLRGSGRKGLSGMRGRADDIIRPMLSIDKESVLRYLEDKNISYCIDSSNTDMRFVRNRVRHSLIPFLERTFDRGIRRALRKTADSLAEDEDLLEDLTREAARRVLASADDERTLEYPVMLLDRPKFRELPAALQRRVVELLLWQLHCPASYSHIMKIVQAADTGKTGSEIHLSRGLRAGVQRERLEFLYPQGQSSWRGRLYPKR